MGCGCGKSAAAAKANVVTYEIEGDPNKSRYLTERQALDAKVSRQLEGAVRPVVGAQ